MFDHQGKIIFKIVESKATTIGGLSEEEVLRLLKVEQELNNEVATRIYRDYGIAIRIHL